MAVVFTAWYHWYTVHFEDAPKTKARHFPHRKERGTGQTDGLSDSSPWEITDLIGPADWSCYAAERGPAAPPGSRLAWENVVEHESNQSTYSAWLNYLYGLSVV